MSSLTPIIVKLRNLYCCNDKTPDSDGIAASEPYRLHRTALFDPISRQDDIYGVDAGPTRGHSKRVDVPSGRSTGANFSSSSIPRSHLEEHFDSPFHRSRSGSGSGNIASNGIGFSESQKSDRNENVVGPSQQIRAKSQGSFSLTIEIPKQAYQLGDRGDADTPISRRAANGLASPISSRSPNPRVSTKK